MSTLVVPSLRSKNEGTAAARGMIENGSYIDAEKELIMLIQKNPSDFEALALRGAALTRMGRHEEANDSCKKAIEANPEYGDAYVIMGEAFFRAGNYGEAARVLQAGLKRSPTDPREASLFLADACIMASDAEGASSALESAGAKPYIALQQRYNILLNSGLSPPKLSGCA